MNSITDPRVEAAARAVEDAMLRQGKSPDAHDLARAAIKAADAATWQPIENAPHNQKVTLGWRKLDGKWQQAFDMAAYDWKCGDYAYGISRHSKATHWMPLPSPPEAKP